MSEASCARRRRPSFLRVGERTFRRWRGRYGEVVAAQGMFRPLYTDRGGLYFHTRKADERETKTARRVGGEGGGPGRVTKGPRIWRIEQGADVIPNVIPSIGAAAAVIES